MYAGMLLSRSTLSWYDQERAYARSMCPHHKKNSGIYVFLFFSHLVQFILSSWSPHKTRQAQDKHSTFLLPSPSPGARWPLGVILYPTPLTNIVIMSSICFISHCPLGQHICAFMHWGHDYHSMFSLHLLFAKAGRRHHLGTELMAGGNPLLKRILQTLCHWMTPIQKSSL